MDWLSEPECARWHPFRSQVWAAGDPANGAQIFKKCAVCHIVEVTGPNKVGPNLHGLLGRNAGSVANYNYSQAMRGSDVISYLI